VLLVYRWDGSLAAALAVWPTVGAALLPTVQGQVLVNEADAVVRGQLQLGARDSGLLLRQLWYAVVVVPTGPPQLEFRGTCCRLLASLIQGNPGCVATQGARGSVWLTHRWLAAVCLPQPHTRWVVCAVAAVPSRLAHILRRAFPPSLHVSLDIVVQFDEYGRVAGYQRPTKSNFGAHGRRTCCDTAVVVCQLC